MPVVRFKPQRGFESEYRQALANNFQPWNVIRSEPTATGQYLLNAMAMGVSEVNQFLKDARRNMYVSTADTLVRTHAYRCEVPQSIKFSDPEELNVLRNAGLSYLGQAWRNQPLEWQVVSGEYYESDAYAGGGSIQLSPNGYFYQIVSGEDFRKGQTYTAGIWSKGDGSGEAGNGQLTIAATGWGFTQSTSANIDLGTTGEWVQTTVSLTVTGEPRTLKLRVDSTPTGDLDVLFSAPMMSEGDSLRSWTPGLDVINGVDFRVWMAGPTGESQQLIDLRPVQNDFQFFEDALPTRLETSPSVTGDVISDNYAPPEFEWTTDYWDCEFRVSGDYIERHSQRPPYDVWNQYSVLDRFMDNESNTGEYGYLTGEYDGFTRTLEALCVWRRRIYLVAKESYGGNTYRVLKVLRWQGVANRLETITDLRVGMDTGDVSSVGFVDGRMDQMALIMSDSAEWTIQLYFDYYFYDPTHRQVLTRHPYTGFTLTFAEL